MGQFRPALPLSNGLLPQSSVSLDPIFIGNASRHVRQPASPAGLMSHLQAPSGHLSTQAAPSNIWQQHSVRQRSLSPSFSGPISHAGSVAGNFLPQQQSTQSWSGPAQLLHTVTPRSTHLGDSGSMHDSLERHHSESGLDLLQSAQGMPACSCVLFCNLATFTLSTAGQD